MDRYVKLVLLALVLFLPGRAEAQGDGPHNLPLIPIDTNIFAGIGLCLSGSFNPTQTVLIPGADSRRDSGGRLTCAIRWAAKPCSGTS